MHNSAGGLYVQCIYYRGPIENHSSIHCVGLNTALTVHEFILHLGRGPAPALCFFSNSIYSVSQEVTREVKSTPTTTFTTFAPPGASFQTSQSA